MALDRIPAPTAVGFIGLGAMGAPQCRNVCRKLDVPVTAFDVVSGRADEAVESGALRGSSVAATVRDADVVLMSLPGSPEADSVLYEPGGVLENARPGTLVIDLSTTSVGHAQQAHERLAERGIEHVDAPVARTRRAAVDGTLAIMVGGSDEAFARAEPVLRTMGTDLTHCGPAGAGALVKLVNNTVVFESVVALAEAVTLARRSGLVPDDVLFDALGRGSAASFVLENHGRSALLPDQHPEGVFPAAYMRKDIGYTLELAATLGVELPGAGTAHALLDRLCEKGYGANYHTAVVRLIEQGQA